MRKLIAALSLVAAALLLCASANVFSSAHAANAAMTPKRVAVVRNLTSDDHTLQFFEGCAAEGRAFGYTVDTFVSDGDDARMRAFVADAVAKKYDGLIVSHGKTDYSHDMLAPAVDAGIKVVTFDTVAVKDDVQLAGITSTAQDDIALAELSLGELEKLGKSGAPARLIKLWLGPGIPPLDRRNMIYTRLERTKKIMTLELVNPPDMADLQGDIARGVKAALGKYGKGDVDGMWGSWDELAKGGLTALREAGRTDIPMYSVDISNQDIALMREFPDIWRGAAAVDPRLIGVLNMRLLAKKFAGEPTPEEYNLEAKLILSKDLKPDTDMNNLADIVPGWGVSDAFNEPWMRELRARNR